MNKRNKRNLLIVITSIFAILIIFTIINSQTKMITGNSIFSGIAKWFTSFTSTTYGSGSGSSGSGSGSCSSGSGKVSGLLDDVTLISNEKFKSCINNNAWNIYQSSSITVTSFGIIVGTIPIGGGSKTYSSSCEDNCILDIPSCSYVPPAGGGSGSGGYEGYGSYNAINQRFSCSYGCSNGACKKG